jgi:hypothetical protein
VPADTPGQVSEQPEPREYAYIRFVHRVRDYSDYLWRQGYPFRGVSRRLQDEIKDLWKELDDDASEQ